MKTKTASSPSTKTSRPRQTKTTHVAFLRGINVGGKKLIKMDALKKVLESLGFENVKTLLASGNVLFQSPHASPEHLTLSIEKALKNAFDAEIGVILRTAQHLQRVAETKPFDGIEVTSATRLYITFLGEKPKSQLPVPYESPGKDFRILHVSKSEVFSVCLVLANGRLANEVTLLDKEFGRKVTTRNWNTIQRILKAAETLE